MTNEQREALEWACTQLQAIAKTVDPARLSHQAYVRREKAIRELLGAEDEGETPAWAEQAANAETLAHKLSGELRGHEDRIRALEEKVRDVNHMMRAMDEADAREVDARRNLEDRVDALEQSVRQLQEGRRHHPPGFPDCADHCVCGHGVMSHTNEPPLPCLKCDCKELKWCKCDEPTSETAPDPHAEVREQASLSVALECLAGAGSANTALRDWRAAQEIEGRHPVIDRAIEALTAAKGAYNALRTLAGEPEDD